MHAVVKKKVKGHCILFEVKRGGVEIDKISFIDANASYEANNPNSAAIWGKDVS